MSAEEGFWSKGEWPRGSGGEVKGWFLFLSQGDKREVYLGEEKGRYREEERKEWVVFVFCSSRQFKHLSRFLFRPCTF